MNIPINNNIQHSIGQQQSAEQTILLNAIRNKFANNENHSGTSPPVFSIPSLKLAQFPTTSSSLTSNDGAPPSKLNQFVLGKLGKTETLPGSSLFSIPDLKIQNHSKGLSFALTEKLNLINKSENEIKINNLNESINDLRVCDEDKSHVIDLTTALNQRSTASLAKRFTPTALNSIDFQIPFIDCDLKETILPLRDEHCQTNVLDFEEPPFISAPSRFGKITCLKYRAMRSNRVDHSFIKKHKIIRFRFDTKSPDDIVLASTVRRCNRI